MLVIGWVFTGVEIYDRLLGLLIGIAVIFIVAHIVNWIRRKIGRMNEKKVVWALKAAGGTMDKAALIRETRLSRWKLDVVIDTLRDKGIAEVSLDPDEFGMPPLVYLRAQRQTGKGNH